MNGIIFFKTKKLDALKEFYLEKIGCEIWLEQADCCILKFGNLLFGFCNWKAVDKCGMITFFYESKEEVDSMYNRFSSIAQDKPKTNPKYKIYHFFAKDPEDRIIEFQWFEKEMNI